jgi:hypothetical protein
MKIQSVCRQLKSIINDKYLWSLKFPDFTFESFNNSLQLVRKILEYYMRIEHYMRTRKAHEHLDRQLRYTNVIQLK